jgi:hypothetical protein
MYKVTGNPVDRVYTTVAAYQPNSNVPFLLDTNALIEELQFQLSGTLTNAAYTTAPIKRVESLENLIANVRLSGTAKNTGGRTADYCSTDAAYMAYRTRTMETTAPVRTDVGVTNAAYAFLSTFKKYFGAKRLGAFYPFTFLDSRNLSSLTANFQFRDVNAILDLSAAVGGTSVLSGVQITVHSREWQDGAIVANAPYVKESQRSFDLTNLGGVDKDFLNAPVGNVLTRQTFKGSVGNTAYSDPSDAIFATVAKLEGAHVKTILNSNYTRSDSTYPQMRANEKTLYNLETVPTGYVTQEYSRTGSIGNALDVRRARTLKNVLDITYTGGSTNTLQITDEEIVGFNG